MTTKCVKMCRNGDGFFPPVNVVINPRDIRNMDAFLDRVTEATRMKNAARRVCTPRKGHKIEDLTKLVPGEMYVAVGQEGFKTLQYGSIQLRKPVFRRREMKIEPVKHSRILMSARCRKVALWESAGLKTIYVYRNGDDKSPSHKILLDRRILLNIDKVLEHVTERVKLESGAVYGLYTLLGKEVNGPSELVSGEKYVAVGHGKRFKRTAYNDNTKVSPNNSPRRATLKHKVIAQTKQRQPSGNTEIKKERVFVERSSGNEVHGTMAVLQREEPSRTLRHVKDDANKRINDENGDDDKLHDHIYKASGVKSEKAKQVDDDQEVKVEKPIDQLPAEEVVEEIVEQDQPENSEDTENSESTENTGDNKNSENTETRDTAENNQNTENTENIEQTQERVKPSVNKEDETVSEIKDNTPE